MKPTVGCIVHYVSYGTPGGEYHSQCRAAIVTELTALIEHSDGSKSYAIGLCAVNPTGLFFNRDVIQSEDDHRGGTWHWPERD